jgi:DNA modification methylase
MPDTETKKPKKKPKELPQGGKVQRMRLSNLTGASYNPRTITDSAFSGLRESLRSFGMLEMPVVNVIDGEFRLVSGHQRVQAMLAEGLEFADCLLVSLTSEQEKIANLTMNNPAIRGTFDAQKAIETLPDLTAQLPRPDYAKFDALLADIRKKVDQMNVSAGAEAAEAATEKPKGKPKSKQGTVYALGKHRLFCGDFAKGMTALGLGKKKKAAACITDPPYNVDYESASGDSIKNDAMNPAEWAAFIAGVAQGILNATAGLSFVCMSSKEVPSLARAWQESGGAVVRWLFWAKDRFTLSRGDYHHQHEPVLLGHKSGANVKLTPGLSSVLEFPKPAANELHPTQKPVALIKALMLTCTEGGDVVFDPFLGSGTTLVVAEEIGRVCFGCELDERFADAIRKRWAEQVHGLDCDWAKRTPAI